MIQNPILRGFNPDPSICRAGDDFYIATSTFEWFPGVQIHHSRDLYNWELVQRPLERLSQLNMLGNPSSGGIWAPCLSYCDGLFYLIYTNVKSWKDGMGDQNGFKDTHNYLVTASEITGPWSEPIYLNSSGFDPSLFHDRDGSKWFINMVWNHRPSENPFSGILLQKYDPVQQKLVGEVCNIFSGTDIASTEGPHLYQKDGYYYLLVAEGGTVYEHAATIARSRKIEGPYEVAPDYPLLRTELRPEEHERIKQHIQKRDSTQLDMRAYSGADFYTRLHKAGHASMCFVSGDKSSEEWALVHLCGRPLLGTVRCMLGRETAIQKLLWPTGEWPRLIAAKTEPATELEFRGFSPKNTEMEYGFRSGKLNHIRENFDGECLNKAFQSLRIPIWGKDSKALKDPWGKTGEPETATMALTQEQRLLLRGGESPVSRFHQSVLALRVSHSRFCAQTQVEFAPTSFQHLAGLMLRYDEANFFYAALSFEPKDPKDPKQGPCIQLLNTNNGNFRIIESIAYSPKSAHLKIESGVGGIDYQAQFSFSIDGEQWQKLGPVVDISILSDEYVMPLGFTGAFVGVSANDMTGSQLPAYFDYFIYEELLEE